MNIPNYLPPSYQTYQVDQQPNTRELLNTLREEFLRFEVNAERSTFGTEMIKILTLHVKTANQAMEIEKKSGKRKRNDEPANEVDKRQLEARIIEDLDVSFAEQVTEDPCPSQPLQIDVTKLHLSKTFFCQGKIKEIIPKPDGSLFILSEVLSTPYIHDFADDGKLLRSLRGDSEMSPLDIALYNPYLIVCYKNSDKVNFFNIGNNFQIEKQYHDNVIKTLNQNIEKLKLLNDKLLIGTTKGGLVIVDLKTNKILECPGHRLKITSFAMSESSFATGSSDLHCDYYANYQASRPAYTVKLPFAVSALAINGTTMIAAFKNEVYIFENQIIAKKFVFDSPIVDLVADDHGVFVALENLLFYILREELPVESDQAEVPIKYTQIDIYKSSEAITRLVKDSTSLILGTITGHIHFITN